jgi:bifunctional UDP-N-acetylglucosamine pyrophosphorylase / glucosamine-1-phosphate N-acetyltransferase
MKTVQLTELAKEKVPRQLCVDTYFDFDKHPFEHQALFTGDDVRSVTDIIPRIGDYAKKWLKSKMATAGDKAKILKPDDLNCNTTGDFKVILGPGALFQPNNVFGTVGDGRKVHTLYIEEGASLFGANIYLDEGDIFIGAGTRVEPDAGIKGPSIIGKDNHIRQGAYFRGKLVIGNSGVYRGELKNVVAMDKVHLPHPGYAGDSLFGWYSHFGNQATAANFSIFGRVTVKIPIGDTKYDVGYIKMGVVMGDEAEIGCNGVFHPGVLVGKGTKIYALASIRNGVYPANKIIKYSPEKSSLIEVVDKFERDENNKKY